MLATSPNRHLELVVLLLLTPHETVMFTLVNGSPPPPSPLLLFLQLLAVLKWKLTADMVAGNVATAAAATNNTEHSDDLDFVIGMMLSLHCRKRGEERENARCTTMVNGDDD